MHHSWLRQLTLGVLAIGLAGVMLGTHPSVATSSAPDDSRVGSLVRQLNDVRRTNHLTPLSVDRRLSLAARDKAEALIADSRLAHETLDGRTPWEFIRSRGYHYELAGENLAAGFLTADAVTTAWLQSRDHRANLLDAGFTDVGIATTPEFIDGRPTTIVVALFGRPDPRPTLLRTVDTLVR